MKISSLAIENFRGIESLVLEPKEGINPYGCASLTPGNSSPPDQRSKRKSFPAPRRLPAGLGTRPALILTLRRKDCSGERVREAMSLRTSLPGATMLFIMK
jgi:hypothetical protein